MKKIIKILFLTMCVLSLKSIQAFAESEQKHSEENQSKTFTISPKGDNNKNKIDEMRSYKLSDLEPTGIYLKDGDTITIETDNDNTAYMMLGPYGKYEAYNDGAETIENVKLKKGTNTYTMEKDCNVVYIRNTSENESITVTIKGGRKLPFFKLGVTDTATFKKQIEDYTDAPFIEIVGERAFGTFQYEKLKDNILAVKSLEELTKYWDRLWQLEGQAYGLTEDDSFGAMRKFKDRFQIINTDTGAGSALATDNYVNIHMKGGLYNELLSYEDGNDQWTIWHEVAHVYQSPLLKWSAGDTDNIANLTEVSVNIGTLYVQKSLGLKDRIMKENGKRIAIEKYLSAPNEGKVYENSKNSEYTFDGDTTNWIKLGMFDQLMMAYGNDIYGHFMSNARIQNKISPEKIPQTNEEKRQYFMKSISEITKRNLKDFFDKWGLIADQDTINTFNKYPKPSVDITENLLPGNENDIVDYIVDYTNIPTASPKDGVTHVLGNSSNDYNLHDLIDIETLENLPSKTKNGISANIIVKNSVFKNTGIYVELENDEGGKNIIPVSVKNEYGNALSIEGDPNSERLVLTLQKDSKTIETFTDEANTKPIRSGTGLFMTATVYDQNGKELKKVSINEEENPIKIASELKAIKYEDNYLVKFDVAYNQKIQSYVDGAIDQTRSKSTKNEIYKIENDRFVHLSDEDKKPTADTKEISTLIGTEVPDPSSLLNNIDGVLGSDDIEVSYVKVPNLKKTGKQEVEINLLDKKLNTSKNIKTSLVVNYGNSLALAAYRSDDIRSVIRLDGQSNKIICVSNPERTTVINSSYDKYWEFKLIRNGEEVLSSSANGTETPTNFTSSLNGITYQEGDIVYVFAAQKFVQNYHDDQLVTEKYEKESVFEIEDNKFIKVPLEIPEITIENDHLLYEKNEDISEETILIDSSISTQKGNIISTDFDKSVVDDVGQKTITVKSKNPVDNTFSTTKIKIEIVNPAVSLSGSITFTDSNPYLNLNTPKELVLTLQNLNSKSNDNVRIEALHSFSDQSTLSLSDLGEEQIDDSAWVDGIRVDQPVVLEKINFNSTYKIKYQITANKQISTAVKDQWEIIYSYVNESQSIQKKYEKKVVVEKDVFTKDDDENSQSSTSFSADTKITFDDRNTPNVPVSPDDPNESVIPVNPENPEENQSVNTNTGNLTLVYAPDFYFGEVKGSKGSYLAKSAAIRQDDGNVKAVVPFITTKDTRGTDRKGWILRVRMASTFVDASNNELIGAELSLDNLYYATKNGAPVASKNKVVLSNDEQEIARAGLDQGIGNWSLGLGALTEDKKYTNGVELTVPKNTAKNLTKYTSTIEWELVEDPTN